MAAAVDPVRIDLRVGSGELFAGAVKEQTTTNAGAFPFDFAQGQDDGVKLRMTRLRLRGGSSCNGLALAFGQGEEAVDSGDGELFGDAAGPADF